MIVLFMVLSKKSVSSLTFILLYYLLEALLICLPHLGPRLISSYFYIWYEVGWLACTLSSLSVTTNQTHKKDQSLSPPEENVPSHTPLAFTGFYRSIYSPQPTAQQSSDVHVPIIWENFWTQTIYKALSSHGKLPQIPTSPLDNCV